MRCLECPLSIVNNPSIESSALPGRAIVVSKIAREVMSSLELPSSLLRTSMVRRSVILLLPPRQFIVRKLVGLWYFKNQELAPRVWRGLCYPNKGLGTRPRIPRAREKLNKNCIEYSKNSESFAIDREFFGIGPHEKRAPTKLFAHNDRIIDSSGQSGRYCR